MGQKRQALATGTENASHALPTLTQYGNFQKPSPSPPIAAVGCLHPPQILIGLHISAASDQHLQRGCSQISITVSQLFRHMLQEMLATRLAPITSSVERRHCHTVQQHIAQCHAGKQAISIPWHVQTLPTLATSDPKGVNVKVQPHGAAM
jgi:hypothetical protein